MGELLKNHKIPEEEDNPTSSSITEEKFLNFLDSLECTHMKVIILASLQYIHDILWQKTPNTNRINYKDFGFTFYESGRNTEYCFHSLHDFIEQLQLHYIQNNSKVLCFVQTIAGIAPKVAFRQILILIEEIVRRLSNGESEVEINYSLTINEYPQNLNDRFRWLRMMPECLATVKLDYLYPSIRKNIENAWKPFVNIFVYTLNQILKMKKQNFFLEELLKNHEPQHQYSKPHLEQIIQECEYTESHREEDDFFVVGSENSNEQIEMVPEDYYEVRFSYRNTKQNWIELDETFGTIAESSPSQDDIMQMEEISWASLEKQTTSP